MKQDTLRMSGSLAILVAALAACGGGSGPGPRPESLAAEVLDARTPSAIPAPSASIAPSADLPVYADGTERINAMLGAGLNVEIPAGVYMINGELKVRAGQAIAPAAAGQVVLKAGDSYAGRFISAYDQRFTVRGLVFDGNYASRLQLEGNDDAAMIAVTGGDGVVLENNVFQYGPATAVFTYRANNLQLTGNTFNEVYLPVQIDGGDLDNTGVVENNAFKNTPAFKSIQHLQAIYSKDLVVRGNTMEGAGLAEPKSHGYEGTWGNSIYIFNSTRYLVEGNRVGKNYWSSLVSGMNGTHATIRNNVFGDGTFTAIAAWIEQAGADSVTFDGNQLDGGLFVGDNGGDHLTITNNVIRSRGVGIDVSSATKTALIQGNWISSKAGYRNNNGMYLWEKKTPDVDVRVSGNHIDGFDKGIAINNMGATGTVYGIKLSGNTFTSNNTDIWFPNGITLNQPLGQ